MYPKLGVALSTKTIASHQSSPCLRKKVPPAGLTFHYLRENVHKTLTIEISEEYSGQEY